MGLISRVPGGYYDITDYLTNTNDRNGTNDVTTAFQNRIDYCRDNDLTLLLPTGTRYQVSNTLKGFENTTSGRHKSLGSIALVGQQGSTPPEIFLGTGATANGFSTTITMGNDQNSIPLLHYFKQDDPLAAYPASEDPEELYAMTIQGIKLNGSGYKNCSLLCADGAQDCILSDLTLEATGCYAGLVGWPGRGSFAKNIKITGGRYGIYQRHPYFIANQSSYIGLGGGFINFELSGQTNYGLWVQGSRGALPMTGMRISMASGVAIYTRSSGSMELGAVALIDSIIEFAGSGIGIQADKARIAIYNSYFRNCSSALDSVETTEPDYAANTTGWFYVKRFINSPATVGGITSRAFIDGVEKTTNFVGSGNGNVAEGPDPRIATQHYWREDDFLDPTKVIWATDDTGTAAPWTSTTAACTPVLDTDLTTDNKALLEAKIAEAAAAGKALFLPRGAAIGQGYYPISGTLTLPANLKGLFGCCSKRSTIWATSAWRTAQASAGENAWLIDTADSASATGYISTLVLAQLYYSATRICMLKWRWGKGVVCNIWGSNQPSGRLDYPTHTLVITGNGGGRIYSARYGGSCQNTPTALAAQNTTDRRLLHAQNTTQPLTIYGGDYEFGGNPDLSPVHAPLVLFDNAKNIRIIGSKCEAWQNVYEIINGSTIYIGPLGALIDSGDPPPANAPLGLFKIDATSGLELFAATKVKTSATPLDMSTIELFDEISGVTPANPTIYSNQGLNYYHRGSLLNFETIWKQFSDTPTPPAGSGFASSIWLIYFEGTVPATSDLAIAELEVAETIGGADISADATITATSGGTGLSNLTDNSTATDFTTTASIALKLVFASPKALAEVRWYASEAGTNVPNGVAVECFDGSLGQLRRMASKEWPEAPDGPRVLRFNRGVINQSMAQRARAKHLSLIA